VGKADGFYEKKQLLPEDFLTVAAQNGLPVRRLPLCLLALSRPTDDYPLCVTAFPSLNYVFPAFESRRVCAAACARAAILGDGMQVALRMQAGYDHSYYFISSFIDDHIAHHAEQLCA